MSAKTRIAKLEKTVKPQVMTWKEFIKLATCPAGWAEFLQESDDHEHKKPIE
jgi:hypothetical protein